MTHFILEINSPVGLGHCAICTLQDQLFRQVRERVPESTCRECMIADMNRAVKLTEKPINCNGKQFRYFSRGELWNEIKCYETAAAVAQERLESGAVNFFLTPRGGNAETATKDSGEERRITPMDAKQDANLPSA